MDSKKIYPGSIIRAHDFPFSETCYIEGRVLGEDVVRGFDCWVVLVSEDTLIGEANKPGSNVFTSGKSRVGTEVLVPKLVDLFEWDGRVLLISGPDSDA